MIFSCAIASTHYDTGLELYIDLERDTKSGAMSEVVSLFYIMVSETYNNAPIIPVLSALVLSTDDTVN